MVQLKCPRADCRHVWEYNGQAKFFACCPDCKTSVSIKINTVQADSFVKAILEKGKKQSKPMVLTLKRPSPKKIRSG